MIGSNQFRPILGNVHRKLQPRVNIKTLKIDKNFILKITLITLKNRTKFKMTLITSLKSYGKLIFLEDCLKLIDSSILKGVYQYLCYRKCLVSFIAGVLYTEVSFIERCPIYGHVSFIYRCPLYRGVFYTEVSNI